MIRGVAVLALCCLLLAACGEEERPRSVGGLESTPLPEGCKTASIDAATARVPRPLEGIYFGQEIWLSYHSKEHEGQGYRFPRTRAEALHKIRQLCRAVHGGADIGELARQWSNAAGGRARGFCAAPHPDNRARPDARDIALYRTPVGELTPLLEWRGGFWFAKRIPDAQGQALGARLAAAAKVRARARIIQFQHKDAYPFQVEYEKITKQKALSAAQWIIEQKPDEQAFAALAKKYSNDGPSGARGGLFLTKHPVTGKQTEWIRWGERDLPHPVVEVILEKATPGTVWPHPIDTGRGVSIVFVIERRTD